MPTTPVGGLFSCVNPVYAVYRTYSAPPPPDAPQLLTEAFVAVEAWDSSGDAYVVGAAGLILAKTAPNFSQLWADTVVRVRAGHDARVPVNGTGGH